jgi:thioredoxin 1
MATIDLTEQNFNDIINNNEMVLIDFWATWCGPCKSFGPIFEDVSEKHENVVFGKINTEEQQSLAAHFQIRSIPTLMIFRDQIIIFSQAGSLPKPALEEVIGKAKSLDMDLVRKEIATQEANKS